jgi:hypothetical protein
VVSKERPIPFTGEMVRKILSGDKTQTRRDKGLKTINANPDACKFSHLLEVNGSLFARFEVHDKDPSKEIGIVDVKCPYGKPGDFLWLKERWGQRNAVMSDELAEGSIRYHATDPNFDCAWKSSMFMPRRASRIDLEITDIRIERVQDISKEDAKAEGVGLYVPGHGFITKDELNADPGYSNFLSPRSGFEMIWNEINGNDAWALNPYVWCISFRRVGSRRVYSITPVGRAVAWEEVE